MTTLHEFHSEVIEMLCELGGCSETDAQILAEEKQTDIAYGHKYRLSPSIVAGALLGINDCCIPTHPLKS